MKGHVLYVRCYSVKHATNNSALVCGHTSTILPGLLLQGCRGGRHDNKAMSHVIIIHHDMTHVTTHHLCMIFIIFLAKIAMFLGCGKELMPILRPSFSYSHINSDLNLNQ